MCSNCGSNLQCDCNIEVKPFCSSCLKDDTCDVKINAKCVFYHLDTNVASNLTCLGIGNKINLEAILEEIDEKLCSYQALQTPLTVVDSTSIDFTAGGTANHTLTGVVKLDTVTGGNILSINSNGLYVPTIPSNLTFDNGLTKTINNIQLGGELIKNTEIEATTFDLLLTHKNQINYSLFSDILNEHYKKEEGLTGLEKSTLLQQTDNEISINVGTTTDFTKSIHNNNLFSVQTESTNYSSVTEQTLQGFTNYNFNRISDKYTVLSNSASLFVAEMRTRGLAPVSYYADGQFAIGETNTTIGHYLPTTSDILTPAPANNVNKTSYLSLSDGRSAIYSKENSIEGQTIIKNQDELSIFTPSAQLEVRSTTRGFLPPVLTEVQKNAIVSPAEGLMIYQVTGTKGIYVFDSTVWRRLSWV